MDKVVLPKEVAAALNRLQQAGYTKYAIIKFAYSPSEILPQFRKDTETLYYFIVNEDMDDLFLSAVVNGYVVKETPEDKIKNYYDKLQTFPINVTKQACVGTMLYTLSVLGVTVKGVND